MATDSKPYEMPLIMAAKLLGTTVEYLESIKP